MRFQKLPRLVLELRHIQAVGDLGQIDGGFRAELVLEIGVDPVSYTHLRAHETVLDLVCRLLLEKKKNNHSPIAL